MKAIKHYAGPTWELKMAENKQGLQIELAGESIDQFHNLMRRAINTMDPMKWPQWVKDIDEMLERD